MYINFYAVLSLINMAICLASYFTTRDLPTMVISAMFAIFFYITFLFDQDGDDFGDYDGM